MVQADTELTKDSKDPDRGAILMMLAYVEAECRRLGSVTAAYHAAIAASLVGYTEDVDLLHAEAEDLDVGTYTATH